MVNDTYIVEIPIGFGDLLEDMAARMDCDRVEAVCKLLTKFSLLEEKPAEEMTVSELSIELETAVNDLASTSYLINLIENSDNDKRFDEISMSVAKSRCIANLVQYSGEVSWYAFALIDAIRDERLRSQGNVRIANDETEADSIAG